MPRRTKKTKASAAATRKGRRAAPCSEASWQIEALWTGGIEYERTIIASPLKVAMMVARSLRDNCNSVTVTKIKMPPNDKLSHGGDNEQ